MNDLAAMIGARRYRLPPGAQLLEAAPYVRPLPGAMPPLLGLASLQGELLPAVAPLCAAAAVRQWLRLPAPAMVLLGVTAIVAAAAEDDDLPLGLLSAAGAAPPPPPLPPQAGRQSAALMRAGPGDRAAVRLALGPGASLDLPGDLLLRVVPMPALPPAPGRQPGMLGYAETSLGPVLVLDPQVVVATASAVQASLLAVFAVSGHRLGLPCHRIGPGDPQAAADSLARLGMPAVHRLLPWAPQAIAPLPEPPLRLRQVVVMEAGTLRFALPAEGVTALLPPQLPAPPPPGAPAAVCGVCAHRGDVLPVIDAGAQLGGRAAPMAARPLLRLAVVPPVAISIDALPALHGLPVDSFTPIAGAALLDSVTRLGDLPLLVCRPEALAAAARPGVAP